MDSEDEVSNASRVSGRHVHYADSSITSTNSDESEFEKYIDEAIDTVEDEDMTGSRRRSNTVNNCVVFSIQ